MSKKIKSPSFLPSDIEKAMEQDRLANENSEEALLANKESGNEVDFSELNEERRKEEQYGDKPWEAGVGSAAAAATFGLSDAALIAAGVPAERINEVRERSSEAAGLGTAAGIIGPAVVSGGTSLAARSVSAPLRALESVSVPAAEALAKAVPGKAAKTIAYETAKNAIEGGAIGGSQLISDIALDKRDLSAESIQATLGTGALWGGGLGGTFGVLRTTVPSALRAGKKAIAPVKQHVDEALAPYLDKEIGYAETIGGTAEKGARLREDLGEYSAKLPDYVDRNLGAGTAKSLYEKNTKVINELNDRLTNTLDAIEASPNKPIKVNATTIYNKIADKLDTSLKQFEEMPGVFKSKITAVKTLKDDIANKLGLKFLPDGSVVQTKPFSFKNIDDTRKLLGKLGFVAKTGEPAEKAAALFARDAQKVLREEINTIADSVGGNLGQELKQINSDLTVGLTVNRRLKVAARKGYAISPKAILAGVTAATTGVISPELAIGMVVGSGPASRYLRNVMLTNDIKGKLTSVMSGISEGVAGSTSRARKITTLGTQALVRSQLALDESGKEPKNNRDALKNMRNNITALQTNPDKMLDILAKRTSRVVEINPELGHMLQQRMVNALSFLQSKMPKSAASHGVFEREYQPSSMELAKFERYHQIVEQPLSAFEELKQGTLTREHIEALQAVYPEIYKEMRLQTLDLLTKEKLKLSYERKLQIGILLNIPADSALQPETLLKLQQSINMQPEQAQPGPQFRPSEMQQTGISERMQSGTEKLSNR